MLHRSSKGRDSIDVTMIMDVMELIFSTKETFDLLYVGWKSPSRTDQGKLSLLYAITDNITESDHSPRPSLWGTLGQ